MKKNRILLLFMLLAFAGTSLKAEVTGGFIEPKEYIVSLFDSGADIVLLAEDHGVRENLEFVRSLLPELYRHGVYMLGMEFGASEDQEVLDSLLTAPEYDERLARELMYRYNCAWAIKEYTDLYHAAWRLGGFRRGAYARDHVGSFPEREYRKVQSGPPGECRHVPFGQDSGTDRHDTRLYIFQISVLRLYFSWVYPL